jgi:hypothetical protein
MVRQTRARKMARWPNSQTSCGKCDTWTGGVGSINIMLGRCVQPQRVGCRVRRGRRPPWAFCTNANDRIGWFRPTWYALITDYGMPATYYHTAYSNDFAMAPDRGDFRQVVRRKRNFFFGRYSALVRHTIRKTTATTLTRTTSTITPAWSRPTKWTCGGSSPINTEFLA